MMTPEMARALAKEIAGLAIWGRGRQFHLEFSFDDEAPENMEAFKKAYTDCLMDHRLLDQDREDTSK